MKSVADFQTCDSAGDHERFRPLVIFALAEGWRVEPAGRLTFVTPGGAVIYAGAAACDPRIKGTGRTLEGESRRIRAIKPTGG